MNIRTLTAALLAFLALAVPATASAAGSAGAVVFSKSTAVEKDVVKGGLFAVKDGRLNQLTEDPADVEPAFSPDGRTIAFARGGDLFSVRPDGSGQRQLTSGPEIDSAPQVSTNGRYVVFERRAGVGAPADLYTVGATGGGLRALTSGANDDREAAFSPDGKAIVFVRGTTDAADHVNDDLFSVRPNGSGLARLTTTAGVDEFAPRYFAGGILYSRGESEEGPAAYADIYTMRRNGANLKSLVAGVGSAYVEDVSPDGHTLLFRRDQGLWVTHIGAGRARKLSQLPDGSKTTSVFSPDGRRVAAFIAQEEVEQLMSIDVKTGRKAELADSFQTESGDSIGPVIAWQP
ncbi:MAG: PD40 domain-containing protein [Solirubrobacterales bacterium]|nr:PD40 domain-containing protein [Solirubrobacterales bacterium]